MMSRERGEVMMSRGVPRRNLRRVVRGEEGDRGASGRRGIRGEEGNRGAIGWRGVRERNAKVRCPQCVGK